MKSVYLTYLLIAGAAMSICVGMIVNKGLDLIMFQVGLNVKQKDSHRRVIAISSGVFTAALILFVELVKVVRYL